MSKPPLYAVRLMNNDATLKADINLPFVPFAGLYMRAPWKRGDYVYIVQVFFNELDGFFEIYADE